LDEENVAAYASAAYQLLPLNTTDVRDLTSYAVAIKYLATYIPLSNNQKTPMSFEDIAKSATGRELLGYVKADVDFLGTIFAQGLRRDQGGYDTVAHSAALSREFDLFFSGWVQHLL